MKSYLIFLNTVLIVLSMSLHPVQAITDGEIEQKIQKHLESERTIEQKVLIADQGDPASCQQFDGSAETKLFNHRNGEDYYITVVGRATTAGDNDSVYARLTSEAAGFAQKTCSMTGYAGPHGEYYSNGVCPNKDATTHFAYRLVTGGFDCNRCDEKCQADRRVLSEQHKNDVHITRLYRSQRRSFNRPRRRHLSVRGFAFASRKRFKANRRAAGFNHASQCRCLHDACR